MSEYRDCYLVYRRNYESHEDSLGREEVLACYATLEDANRRAKDEMNRIYLPVRWRDNQPKNCSNGDKYAAVVVLDNQYPTAYDEGYVISGFLQREEEKRQEEESGSESESESIEALDIKAEPRPLSYIESTILTILRDTNIKSESLSAALSSPQPIPLPLPRGLIRGEMPEEDEVEEVEDVVEAEEVDEGGEVDDGEEVVVEKVAVEEVAEGVGGGSFAKWVAKWKIPVIDQKKFFLMIESLSGTPLVKDEDLERMEDALDRAEGRPGKRRKV
ncbi:uncharacterized protein PAC_14672 [Phialocephala subalpina]|uniref:Uncharacterized protein n=1 Tax=Phialocephala subalpina TaxID=576137 RepID=A0A1L7XIB4_9HELO|nr:uncharacterized protein PAC_14672 [Phialocephala subalpina]